MQGFLFGIGQPQTHEWVHKLTRILNQALGEEQQLPEREPQRLEAVLMECPILEFIVDGTERRICRPKDKEAQKDCYSGKKKAHPIKNNLIAERSGKVVFLSDTYAGRVHNKAICDGEDYCFPPAASCGKTVAFRDIDPKMSQPCSRGRNRANRSSLRQTKSATERFLNNG